MKTAEEWIEAYCGIHEMTLEDMVVEAQKDAWNSAVNKVLDVVLDECTCTLDDYQYMRVRDGIKSVEI